MLIVLNVEYSSFGFECLHRDSCKCVDSIKVLLYNKAVICFVDINWWDSRDANVRISSGDMLDSSLGDLLAKATAIASVANEVL